MSYGQSILSLRNSYIFLSFKWAGSTIFGDGDQYLSNISSLKLKFYINGNKNYSENFLSPVAWIITDSLYPLKQVCGIHSLYEVIGKAIKTAEHISTSLSLKFFEIK